MSEVQEDLITEEIRSLIGVEWPPVVYEVERTGIRMWARAVGIEDPVFHDEAEARRRGFERLPAPPGFLGVPRVLPGQPEPGPPIRGLNPRLQRSLNGGTEVELCAPILAGDELVATSRIVEVKQRAGRVGPMLIITRETAFRRGQATVARVRATVINY
ncbi:MAG TPA: MaoC family dehydratase N-terminal domain-containing protein [Actinomycetota bacterium]|nr:MaoC family dehydratase N-terminal domain-containing protein [Actinomycetota bacterium]